MFCEIGALAIPGDQSSSNKLIGLGDRFLRFSDRDELIVHGLCTTIPRFVEKRYGRAFRLRWRNAGRLALPRCRMRRAPDMRKNLRSRKFKFFPALHKFGNLAAQSINAGSSWFPGKT